MRSARCLLVVTALVWCVAPRGRAESSADAERSIGRAEQALERGNRPRALSLLRGARLRHPEDLLVRERLARLLLEADACPAARDLQEADKLTANFDEPAEAAEKAAFRSLRLARALVDACLGHTTSSALEAAREDARRGDLDMRAALSRLGLIYVRARALDAAQQWLAVAHELSPEDVTIGRDYAAVLLALGRSHHAARVLSMLHRHSPTDLALRRDYAGALTAAGLAEEALEVLEVAREACTNMPACIAQAGRTALEAGHPERSLRWVEGATQQPALLMVRADALKRLGRLDEARAVYSRVLALDPVHKRAKQALNALDRAPAE
jgi:Flp pilus assembly protein TadD